MKALVLDEFEMDNLGLDGATSRNESQSVMTSDDELGASLKGATAKTSDRELFAAYVHASPIRYFIF